MKEYETARITAKVKIDHPGLLRTPSLTRQAGKGVEYKAFRFNQKESEADGLISKEK